jgi:succinoglycan biosynthesis transport protein ExoP
MATIDNTKSMGDYFALLRRRKIYLVTIMPAAALLSICLAYGLPATYQATATILIEESAVSNAMVATTVVNTAPDVQIELVRRRALSPDELKALIARLDPYPDEPDLSIGQKATMISLDTSVEKVDPITFKPVVNGTAFSIYYNNPNAVVASQIAGEIAKIFLAYNRKSRTESAEQTYQFLLQKSKLVEVSMRDADQRISDFKRRYGAALPEDQLRNQQAMDRAQITLDDVQAHIRVAEQREADLALQLGQISPSLVGSVLNTPTDVATLKAQLADAESRYKPDHPDVKRLRRALDELLARRGASNAAGEAQPDNPDYLRVASDLKSARKEIAALREVAARGLSERQILQSQLAIAPSVEKDYTQLIRNRDLLKEQYQQLAGKLQEADIGKSYENEQQGERFTLIRAPSVPDSPYSPNRLGLILIGFVLGGALAIGFAVMADNADPTVRGYLDVQEAVSVPMLGAIPALLNPMDRRHTRRVLLSGIVALAVATVATAFLVVRSEHLAHVAAVDSHSKGDSR